MAIITTNGSFNPTAAVTSTTLNAVADAATFNDPVDETSLELITSGTNNGKLQIKDAGVTAAKLATDALELAYPVGSIYMNASDATDPGTLLGFGTWATFGAGKVPVGIDSTDADFDVVGSGTNTNGTTGAKTVSLSEAELPQHHHLAAANGAVSETGDVTSSNAISESATQSGSTYQSYTMRPAIANTFGTVGRTSQVGSGTAHNNLQPYIVVHMWTRTA
mgnify:CR=1 FL=1|tara:strand:- start:433 stop:1095 length:663 start_codon:yes stop_codon:yes gene_type:complete